MIAERLCCTNRLTGAAWLTWDRVILPSHSQDLSQQLNARGFEVAEVDMSEIFKTGGGIHCNASTHNVSCFLRIFRFYLATIFLAFAFVFLVPLVPWGSMQTRRFPR